MNSRLSLFSAPLSLIAVFAMAGCAVDGTPADEPTSEDRSALTSGAGDPSGSTGTVAEKPAFDISACIYRKVQDEGWGQNRATAYCYCRAKGYSDWYCSYTIPYIDI